jgi:hypothetical protein
MLGEPDTARAEFAWFAEDEFSNVPHDMFWLPTMCMLGETCALMGDTDRAAWMYDRLRPFKDRNVQVTQAVTWGSVERFLGLLAAALDRRDDAAAHFQSAIAKNLAGGNVAAAAVVRRDYARMLYARRAEGDLDLAAELLAVTLTAAQVSRTQPLISHIEAEIQAVEDARLTG